MKQLNCEQFKEMVVSGYNNLANQYEEIDKLNVFPVPDGDTGTNMNMTFSNGVKETSNYINNHIGDTCKFLSKQMLMGARGNSGVILSQVFKGMAKEFDGLEVIDPNIFAKGLLTGAKIAYKAVMRPVEGTILTVVRETAEYAVYYAKTYPNCEFVDMFDYLQKEAKESLKRTPDLLPTLKKANVVDSGAAGFVAIIDGFYQYFKGTPVKLDISEVKKETLEGYHVRVVVDLNDLYQVEFKESKLRNSLNRTCNNISVIRTDDTVEIICNSTHPGDIINIAQRFGQMKDISIENLYVNNSNYTEEIPHEKYAIISVCNGAGIEARFKELGVKYFVSGGQTMNPSTQDFVDCINKLNADHIIILPNNSNIILAAKQAKEVLDKLDITVIESKTIPQGINACINFNIEGKIQENVDAMTEAVKAIKTISITTAVKNTEIDGIEIHENDYMALVDKQIVASSINESEAINKAIDIVGEDGACYFTVIKGKQASDKDAEKLLLYAANKWDIEGEIIDGQQDLYPFYIGVE